MKPRKINHVSAALLASGLGAAVTIYCLAGPELADPLDGYRISKRYLHELRVIGGKSNVIFAEMTAWFSSLWHGRNLAGTVAVLTVLVTLAFRFVAARPDIYAPESVKK